MTNRVAVLVDGDNISASFADQILGCGKRLGRVDVTRVYAGANSPAQWLTMAGFRYFHAGTGKNAADLLLTIDAMELAYRAGPDAFVIASSDGDFTHLALRLREKGHHVCGIGEAKAPNGFRAACSEFVQVKVAAVEAKKPMETPIDIPISASAPITEPANLCSAFDRNIRTMIALNSKNGQGMRLTELASKMHAAYGVQIGKMSDRTWRGYLSKRPNLYDLDPSGQLAMVRFRPAGFASGSHPAPYSAAS